MTPTIPLPPTAKNTPIPSGDTGGFLGYYPQGSYITLCSIYPARLVSQRFPHANMTKVGDQMKVGTMRTYEIEAGSVEKPAYLRIYDTVTLTQNTNQMERDDPAQIPRPITAAQIVKDLLTHWSGDHYAHAPGDAAVGVFICKGDKATTAELETARRQQEELGRRVIGTADSNWMNPQKRQTSIYAEARRWAKWMGVSDEVSHPWLSSIRQTLMKVCPACATEMSMAGFICVGTQQRPGCNTNVAKYFLDRGIAVEKGSWPSVENELAFLQKAGAALAPPAGKG